MGRGRSSTNVNVNVDYVRKVVDDFGIPATKLSVSVMGKGSTYISEMLRTGIANPDALKKLCDFLSIDYTKAIDVPSNAVEIDSPNVNLDAVILGITQLYKMEQANNEIMAEILQELKVANQKSARLEGIVQTAVSSMASIKINSDEMKPVIRDIKSSTATINGRVKDLISSFK